MSVGENIAKGLMAFAVAATPFISEAQADEVPQKAPEDSYTAVVLDYFVDGGVSPSIAVKNIDACYQVLEEYSSNLITSARMMCFNGAGKVVAKAHCDLVTEGWGSEIAGISCQKGLDAMPLATTWSP